MVWYTDGLKTKEVILLGKYCTVFQLVENARRRRKLCSMCYATVQRWLNRGLGD